MAFKGRQFAASFISNQACDVAYWHWPVFIPGDL